MKSDSSTKCGNARIMGIAEHNHGRGQGCERQHDGKDQARSSRPVHPFGHMIKVGAQD